MKKFKVLEFSIRADAATSYEELAPLVARALGCTLLPGEFHHLPCFEGEPLGMHVVLNGWHQSDVAGGEPPSRSECLWSLARAGLRRSVPLCLSWVIPNHALVELGRLNSRSG